MPLHGSLQKCHLPPINSLTLNKGNWLHMDLIARVLGKLRGASFLKGEGGTVVCAARRGLGGSSADVATLEGRPGAYRSGQTTPPS